MFRDNERHKLFSRRTAMLAGGKMLLLSALVGRMYYLQVVEAKRYSTLSDKNRINLRLLPPPRGLISDRFGKMMAVNRQNYRVVLIPEQTRNIGATLSLLGRFIPISSGDKRRILREIRRKRAFMPITIRENLSWDDVARIEVNTLELPGVMVDVGQSRYYPNVSDTAHILGYVAAVSEDEIYGDPLLELPGFRIGKSGIEKVYDLPLRGTGGSSQVEVNAAGQVIRELSRRNGKPGTNLELTIDVELQKMVSRRLSDQSAAAVVMDIHSGEIFAIVSTPSFDPNAFNKGLSIKEWNKLVYNPKSPLINKAISGQYAPGSTFKMIVAMAALDKGIITTESTFFCSGSITFGGEVFHCWKKSGHGIVNLNKGIVESCDVYFYEVARRTGIDRIAAMARRFGLGHTLGIDLPAEHSGLVPTKEWKLSKIGAPWQQGETLIAGIGQGYLLVTPLQLAVMVARLTNGGFAITPHMTRNIPPSENDSAKSRDTPENLGFSSENIKIILKAMRGVVNTPSGTAYRSRIRKPGFGMGGKTA